MKNNITLDDVLLEIETITLGDYVSLFKKTKKQEGINRTGMERLHKNFPECFLVGAPIKVNQKNEILHGNHRHEVAKEQLEKGFNPQFKIQILRQKYVLDSDVESKIVYLGNFLHSSNNRRAHAVKSDKRIASIYKTINDIPDSVVFNTTRRQQLAQLFTAYFHQNLNSYNEIKLTGNTKMYGSAIYQAKNFDLANVNFILAEKTSPCDFNSRIFLDKFRSSITPGIKVIRHLKENGFWSSIGHKSSNFEYMILALSMNDRIDLNSQRNGEKLTKRDFESIMTFPKSVKLKEILRQYFLNSPELAESKMLELLGDT